MANAFSVGGSRGRRGNMRRAVSENLRDTPTPTPQEMSHGDISNPVLTGVKLYRPVRREGSPGEGEYDLAQVESSLVLRFPLYDIHNNSETNLKRLLSHQNSEGELRVPSQGDQEGRGQAIAEIEHNQEQAQVQNGAQANAWNHGRVQTNGENQKAAKEQSFLPRDEQGGGHLPHDKQGGGHLPHDEQGGGHLPHEDQGSGHLPHESGHPSSHVLPPTIGQGYLDDFSVSHSPYARRVNSVQSRSSSERSAGRDLEQGVKLYDSIEDDECIITSEVTPRGSPNLDISRRTISVPGIKTAGADRGSEARVLTVDQALEELKNPHSAQTLQEALIQHPTLVNCSTNNHEAPIHTIVKMKRRDKSNLLLTLLTNSSADVNIETSSSRLSPLHQAVLEEDELCVKTLLSFGANIKSTDMSLHTPLQVCSNPKLIDLLEAVEASRIEPDMPDESYEANRCRETLMEYIRRRGEANICDEMEEATNRIFSLSLSHSLALTEIVDTAAVAFQKREIAQFRKTNPHIPRVLREGDRILCLDGGGMKGLAQIEVLSQLEEATGRRITQLFDWIVGTSTGAIIALAMVYVHKTLPELRRLYFQLKEKVFASKGPNNSQSLQDILRSTFGTTMLMSDVTKPKILIGAVDKSTTNLQFHFFNNCFGDEFSTQLVWKVARYTSAAPSHFTEFENYVDGGVLANNPCEYALTAIQNFYREQKMRPPVSLLLSVGSGVYPALKLGNVDAQQFLYFGIHTFRLDILKDRASNLLSLLSNALVESEAVAKNCRSRCEEQGILFYRISPKLDEVVEGGETDTEKLINMLIQTKLQVKEQGLGELVQLLRDFRRNHS